MSSSRVISTYPPLEIDAAARGFVANLIGYTSFKRYLCDGSVDPGLLFGSYTFQDLEAKAGEVSSIGGKSYLCHLGRGATYLAAKSLASLCECGRTHSVAVPSYHCGSEIEAVVRAGLQPRFYRVRSNLGIDSDSYFEAASKSCIEYLISFFGFPPSVEGAWPLEEKNSRAGVEAAKSISVSNKSTLPGVENPLGLKRPRLVIEDAAHALFSKYADGSPIGSKGSAAVFSIRKSLGTLDGGALWIEDESGAGGTVPTSARARFGSKAEALASQLLLALANNEGWIARFASRILSALSRSEKAAMTRELSEAVYGFCEAGEGRWELPNAAFESASGRAALITYFVLTGQWPREVLASRRANYTRLLWEFELAEFVPDAFRQLPEGVAPLFLPVMCEDRPTAVSSFFERGVRVVEVWPLSHRLVPSSLDKELRGVRESLIGLPVHQALSGSGLELVGEVASDVLRRIPKKNRITVL